MFTFLPKSVYLRCANCRHQMKEGINVCPNCGHVQSTKKIITPTLLFLMLAIVLSVFTYRYYACSYIKADEVEQCNDAPSHNISLSWRVKRISKSLISIKKTSEIYSHWSFSWMSKMTIFFYFLYDSIPSGLSNFKLLSERSSTIKNSDSKSSSP